MPAGGGLAPEATQRIDVDVAVSRLAAGQRRILEGIASGVPLAQTLEGITRLVEAEAPGIRASVLLRSGDRLVHGAAPSLPAAYNAAIDGIAIGPGVGSCGTAAHEAKAVVVEDVRTHPFWESFRALAAEHGIRACWSTPILDREGSVVGTFALYHDVPRGPRPEEERLVAEASHLATIAIQHDALLRAHAERIAEERKRVELREFLRRAPMAVALIEGPDFVFAFTNPTYERLVGRSGLEGKRLVDAFPEVGDQGIVELLRSVYASGEPWEVHEMRVELDRGRGRREEGWFSGRLEPYRDAEGRVTGLLSVSVEVTEQVKARQELELRRAEIAVHEKTSVLGQLVSGVAHEIRTPLTYLATNLNLIQLRLDRLAKTLPPEQAEPTRMLVEQYIPSALEGVDRINHIVEDLRGFTQQRTDVRETVKLRDVVAQAVSLFQATNRGRVGVQFDPSDDVVVAVDKLQVQQAVLNLLQNALEAEPRDHAIHVRIGADAEGAVVEVADLGHGIPPAVQARVFDPFYTTRKGGTGLGLSIVKRIVEDHRGRVWFETGPEGTRFRMRFPTAGQDPKIPYLP